MNLRDALVLGMGSLALLWYYACLFTIGTTPLSTVAVPDTFRQFMSLSLTTIGASLATFIGMLLGIRNVADSVKPEVSDVNSPQIQRLASGSLTTTLQWIAAGLYVLSLVVAIWFWYKSGDNTDPAVSNLGTTLLGLVGGALAILLNLPPRHP